MNETPALGVIPPIVTPFDASGEIDVPSLVNLTEHLLRANVAGIFALGSSGEATGLSNEQRDLVLGTVVSTVGRQVPVFAGVIETSTNRILPLIERAQDLGAAAVVATAPFYASSHPDEVATHFRSIRGASNVPVFAYDIPSRVGFRLLDETVALLAAENVISGIKDSSGYPARIRRLVRDRTEAARLSFSILTGSEVTADTDLLLGADGVVPGLGNVDPDSYVAIFEAVKSGHLATAVESQSAMIELFKIVDVPDRSRIGGTAGPLGAFKAALYLRGVISSPLTCTPGGQLIEPEIEAIRTILKRLDLL